MARRRLKHKQVIETIEQDDIQVALNKVKAFWTDTVRPNESLIWTSIIVIAIAVGGFMWWKNNRMSRQADANSYLAEALADFASGDSEGVLSELNYVLPGGDYADGRIGIAAEMTQASIAYASGDYESAISI